MLAGQLQAIPDIGVLTNIGEKSGPGRRRKKSQKKKQERIGILVVHGIGDQNRNEHLQSVAQNLVRAASIMFGKELINVEMFPGVENWADLSILISSSPGEAKPSFCIDLHEVWWRDLGQRPSPWSVVQFWMWAATFAGTRGRFGPDTPVTNAPTQESKSRTRVHFVDRVLLFSKITYFFVLLFPIRVSIQLINILPGIRPINLFRTVFSYLSSVQLYQQRHGRKGGTLVDFDQSLRISIQRRFANAAITISERGYDRWYVMGHSLGSVIALKGLMYPDDAVARLMGFNRWNHPNFPYRSAVSVSDDYPDKPQKPGWLDEKSAVDTVKVFEKCRGFISWGSPLETFARTWPAMVHLRRKPPFPPKFEWINIYDPVDVVASRLTSYDSLPSEFRPHNVVCRSSMVVLTAHNKYLWVSARSAGRRVCPTLLSWMLQDAQSFSSIALRKLKSLSRREIYVRRAIAAFQWLLVLVFGLSIWPVSVGLFLRIVAFIPRNVEDFFTGGQGGRVSALFERTDKFIQCLQPTINIFRDGLNFFVIMAIIVLVLSVGGFLHHVIDYVIEKFVATDRVAGNTRIATTDYTETPTAMGRAK